MNGTLACTRSDLLRAPIKVCVSWFGHGIDTGKEDKAMKKHVYVKPRLRRLGLLRLRTRFSF